MIYVGRPFLRPPYLYTRFKFYIATINYQLSISTIGIGQIETTYR